MKGPTNNVIPPCVISFTHSKDTCLSPLHLLSRTSLVNCREDYRNKYPARILTSAQEVVAAVDLVIIIYSKIHCLAMHQQ